MTYEIKDIIVKHEIAGDLQKKIVVYYDDKDSEITKEAYYGESDIEVREKMKYLGDE